MSHRDPYVKVQLVFHQIRNAGTIHVASIDMPNHSRVINNCILCDTLHEGGRFLAWWKAALQLLGGRATISGHLVDGPSPVCTSRSNTVSIHVIF